MARTSALLRPPIQLVAVGFVALTISLLRVWSPIVLAAGVLLVAATLALLALVRAFAGAHPDFAGGQWLRRTTLIVFGSRVLVSLVITNSPELIRTFDGDAITYHLGAIGLLRHWQSGAPLPTEFIAAGKEGFFYMLAALYFVFGSFQVAGLVVNAALAAALVPISYDTTRRMFGDEPARVAAIIVSVLPCFVIWTSQLLREAPVLFLLGVAANAAVRLSERTTASAYLLFGGSLALLFTLRANVALVAAAGLLLGVGLGHERLLGGVATGGAVAGFVTLIVVVLGVGYAGYQASTAADLKQDSAARQDLARSASSGYAANQDISTTGKALGFLPTALPNFAFGPFPWDARNFRQAGGVLEALSLWFLFPSLVRGVRGSRRVAGRRWLVLAIPAVLLTISLSLLIGNFGTVVRERLHVTVLLVPFAACGWVRRPHRAHSDGAALSSAALSSSAAN